MKVDEPPMNAEETPEEVEKLPAAHQEKASSIKEDTDGSENASELPVDTNMPESSIADLYGLGIDLLSNITYLQDTLDQAGVTFDEKRIDDLVIRANKVLSPREILNSPKGTATPPEDKNTTPSVTSQEASEASRGRAPTGSKPEPSPSAVIAELDGQERSSKAKIAEKPVSKKLGLKSDIDPTFSKSKIQQALDATALFYGGLSRGMKESKTPVVTLTDASSDTSIQSTEKTLQLAVSGSIKVDSKEAKDEQSQAEEEPALAHEDGEAESDIPDYDSLFDGSSTISEDKEDQSAKDGPKSPVDIIVTPPTDDSPRATAIDGKTFPGVDEAEILAKDEAHDDESISAESKGETDSPGAITHANEESKSDQIALADESKKIEPMPSADVPSPDSSDKNNDPKEIGTSDSDTTTIEVGANSDEAKTLVEKAAEKILEPSDGYFIPDEEGTGLAHVFPWLTSNQESTSDVQIDQKMVFLDGTLTNLGYADKYSAVKDTGNKTDAHEAAEYVDLEEDDTSFSQGFTPDYDPQESKEGAEETEDNEETDTEIGDSKEILEDGDTSVQGTIPEEEGDGLAHVFPQMVGTQDRDSINKNSNRKMVFLDGTMTNLGYAEDHPKLEVPTNKTTEQEDLGESKAYTNEEDSKSETEDGSEIEFIIGNTAEKEEAEEPANDGGEGKDKPETKSSAEVLDGHETAVQFSVPEEEGNGLSHVFMGHDLTESSNGEEEADKFATLDRTLRGSGDEESLEHAVGDEPALEQAQVNDEAVVKSRVDSESDQDAVPSSNAEEETSGQTIVLIEKEEIQTTATDKFQETGFRMLNEDAGESNLVVENSATEVQETEFRMLSEDPDVVEPMIETSSPPPMNTPKSERATPVEFVGGHIEVNKYPKFDAQNASEKIGLYSFTLSSSRSTSGSSHKRDISDGSTTGATAASTTVSSPIFSNFSTGFETHEETPKKQKAGSSKEVTVVIKRTPVEVPGNGPSTATNKRNAQRKAAKARKREAELKGSCAKPEGQGTVKVEEIEHKTGGEKPKNEVQQFADREAWRKAKKARQREAKRNPVGAHK